MINLLTKLIEWAKRDNVCAAALLLGIFASAPHLLESLTFFVQNALIPLAHALGGK
jgi:hypothetical protein